jgi:replicative DNA helicase Mcm
MAEEVVVQGEGKKTELTARFKELLHKKYKKALNKASLEEGALEVDFEVLSKFSYELGDTLLSQPDLIYEVARDAIESMEELPGPVPVRFFNLPEMTSIRDLRTRHLKRFISAEGTVRRASEIRPEIQKVLWECPECGDILEAYSEVGMIRKPFACKCGNRMGFKKKESVLVDTRWITIEEPFELTEGDRPSQINVILTDDLVSPDGRRITDPGNRIKVTGILRETPKGKLFSSKLDLFISANHVEATELGWHRLDVSEEDIEVISRLARDPKIYDLLVGSLAPSLYGMKEIKESIILQLFGGVPRHLKDKTHIRGDIHVLLIGDPASGKSQLLKLVPEIVPRGKYVSGKGTTGAGLTATVTKDEQFMGGWVLEAGAMVLANRGMLAVDEFEKMSPEDQVAMHEGLEQGTVSIAKASIVATLPAKTSVLAGGNPKFSRFDPYVPIAKQITISDTLLSRFDLKFALRDVPDSVTDKSIVDHVLRTREDENFEGAVPKIDPDFIRKYIAYARDKCEPRFNKEAGRMLRNFYIKTRKKSEGSSSVPITMRQFEALIRLSEASARVQMQPEVRKEDAQRAIRLMKFSLSQLGFDPETGEIDIDRSEGGTPASERSKIRIVLDMIDKLSAVKKEISLDELRSSARGEGIDEIDEIIERLKTQGLLFEPSPGFVQKV